ncbi:MAG: porin [Acidobacteria bacterium]|nr:porin [Acidobacteriota bacterium]
MPSFQTFRHRVFLGATVLAILAAPAARADASNEALLKLLRILRDRGSISANEYEELRAAAAEEPAAAPSAPAPAEPSSVSLATRVQALDSQTAGQGTDVAVKKALAGKWYDKIGLRGYTQFRYSTVPRTFIIRRGRLVFSGDVSHHLYLYAQADFNGSTGAADYSLQMRDLYADIAFDRDKAFRVRLGQSKVPFGWVNMQSSSNRAAFERPDGMNSAVEGERDYGAYFMWAPLVARQRFGDLTSLGLKGSGDYGVVAVGLYNGQGPNRADQNGEPHTVARWAYPFKLASGQFVELGVQAYHGTFVTATQAIVSAGSSVTPSRPSDGVGDQRVGVTAVWYPQPFGIEAEWNVGRGPELSDDLTRIERRGLSGGYVQASYRRADGGRSLFPFARWQYYNGGRKFARNAPHLKVNELDLGLEFARWAELELTMVYTRTFERTRPSAFPFASTRNANRLGFQAQWNY